MALAEHGAALECALCFYCAAITGTAVVPLAAAGLEVVVGTAFQALLFAAVNTRCCAAEAAVTPIPDLDKHEFPTIVHDQVDFAMAAAVVPLFHAQTGILQVFDRCSFGRRSLAQVCSFQWLTRVVLPGWFAGRFHRSVGVTRT